jgi:hypothetical protein
VQTQQWVERYFSEMMEKISGDEQVLMDYPKGSSKNY